MQYLDVVILSKIICEIFGVSNSIVWIKGANHEALMNLGFLGRTKSG
jgi:hypothetical protein